MMKGAIGASLALAASVVAASGSYSLRVPSDRREAAARSQQRAEKIPAPTNGAREFAFRRLIFTVPASWQVQRADQRPFHPEYVTVTGRSTGPRLTFSDTVQLVRDSHARAGQQAGDASVGKEMAFERFEMPNPMMRGVTYVFPAAGVSISAQVRTEAEVRAADAVARSARWSLPSQAPARS